MSEAANKIGIESSVFKETIEDLIDENPTPCILYWRKSHFVVLFKIKKKNKQTFFYVADPECGKIKLNEKEFQTCWLGDESKGIVMVLSPTASFYSKKNENKKYKFFFYIKKYISDFKRDFLSLLYALFASSLLALFLPFLTQILIDKGLNLKSTNIILMVIASQLIIYLGATSIEIIRNWLVLFIGARVNINIISNYLHKMIRLHISFFDTKFLDDFYQRIQDHSRIEKFLTSQTLTTFFSLITLLIYTIVLMKYKVEIFLLYFVGTVLAVLWSILFMKVREKLDYFRFKYNSLTQETITEIVSGIQEIKLNKFENYKIRKWELVQQNALVNNQKILRTEQMQMIGFSLINQIKTIIISLITALLVVQNKLTLGEMISVSFIISQIDAPITQLVHFFKSLQDAKLSLNRLIEIQDFNEEDQNRQSTHKMRTANKGIEIHNVCFQYEDPLSKFVVNNASLSIPKNKVTAIVGKSGCGKTTLLKLLLKLYNPTKGDIFIDGQNLMNIPFEKWREECGAVMQDTYIFSETIARNIALSDENIDYNRVEYALKKANIYSFVDTLPKKTETIIGARGNGLSNGQRQRLILARILYKNPKYIFLDEATSSLDAINERTIYNNIKDFFNEKTVIIIAHRLSTIRNADQIVVMNDGMISEIGTHNSLIKKKGEYYKLIQNQI